MHLECNICSGKLSSKIAYGIEMHICLGCKIVTRKVKSNENCTSQYSSGSRECFLFEFASGILEQPKTLIFGCGITHGPTYLSARDPNVYFTDSNIKVTEFLSSKIGSDKVILADLLYGYSSRFDLIIANEVIEHFENPAFEMQKLMRLLSGSGILVGVTDFFDGESIEEPSGYIAKPGHNTYWTEAALEIVANDFGADTYFYKMFRPGSLFESKRNNLFRPRKKVFFISKQHEQLFKTWSTITEFIPYFGE